LSDADRDRLGAYVAHFNARDFDAIRAMIADDVRRPTPDDMPAGCGRPGIATRAG
jgi:ketosteroid isomerase-like protein